MNSIALVALVALVATCSACSAPQPSYRVVTEYEPPSTAVFPFIPPTDRAERKREWCKYKARIATANMGRIGDGYANLLKFQEYEELVEQCMAMTLM